MSLLSLHHGLTDLHGDPPRGVLVDLQIPRQLESREPLFGIEYQHDSEEPLLKRHVGMVKDGSDGYAKRGLAGVAAMSMLEPRRPAGPAVWTARGAVPPRPLKMLDARLLGWKLLENLHNVHDN